MYEDCTAPRATSSQAPGYASAKLWPSHLLTGVKCRATSVAKNATVIIWRSILTPLDVHVWFWLSLGAIFLWQINICWCLNKFTKLRKYVELFSLYSDQWPQAANMISPRCTHTHSYSIWEATPKQRQTNADRQCLLDMHTAQTQAYVAMQT